MPQQSIYYACGRVGVLERSALGTSQIERLMAAHSYEEACGYFFHGFFVDFGFALLLFFQFLAAFFGSVAGVELFFLAFAEKLTHLFCVQQSWESQVVGFFGGARESAGAVGGTVIDEGI